MKYEIKQVTKKYGLLYTQVIEEKPVANIYKDLKKGLARKAIQEDVFDLADSVADNAKMISLLMSMVKRIYEALPDDIKNSVADKDMIESVINIFDNTQTLADVQFEEQGDDMIAKIFERQGKIGEIVKNIYENSAT